MATFDSRPVRGVAVALACVLIAYIGVKTVLSVREVQQIGKPEPTQNTVTVEGLAKLKLSPDLATLHVGVTSKGATVAAVQEQNTKKMNEIINKIKALGFEDKDIQTEYYNTYEDIQWLPEGGNVSKGWIVSQQAKISVRDLNKVSDVIAAAGQANATNISGPEFTIEDPNKYREEARKQAVENARANAQQLSETLGLRFEKVIGYNEWISSGSNPYVAYSKEMGYGGGEMAVAPAIQPGTEEIVFNVSVIYKLKE
jgi:hypothetical protein